ncbi:hypothetical protein CDAR_209691 [Caerostris darwini]|uniref:Uncharacterized protein n=1 Tax=Caerostris darwini TaxID=1538125 RepID=A0AAV4T3B1_9ARAC|nr:hypothetical protein CDAR_209691 [Caerostris darwini]
MLIIISNSKANSEVSVSVRVSNRFHGPERLRPSVSGEEKRKKSGPRDSPVAVSRRCGSRASRGRRWKGWGAHSGREGLYPHSEQCREASILQLKWCRASWASARERERDRR